MAVAMIPSTAFTKSERVGAGSFGNVFRGVWAGQAVAIKEPYEQSPGEDLLAAFHHEVHLVGDWSGKLAQRELLRGHCFCDPEAYSEGTAQGSLFL